MHCPSSGKVSSTFKYSAAVTMLKVQLKWAEVDKLIWKPFVILLLLWQKVQHCSWIFVCWFTQAILPFHGISCPYWLFRTHVFYVSAYLKVLKWNKMFFLHFWVKKKNVRQSQDTISNPFYRKKNPLCCKVFQKYQHQWCCCITHISFHERFSPPEFLNETLLLCAGRGILFPADGSISGAADPLHVQGTEMHFIASWQTKSGLSYQMVTGSDYGGKP